MLMKKACKECRKKKILCSKTSPECSYCEAKKIECVYQLDNSTSKFSTFVAFMENDIAKLEDKLNNGIQTKSFEDKKKNSKKLNINNNESDTEAPLDAFIEAALEKASRASLFAVSAEISPTLDSTKFTSSHLLSPMIMCCAIKPFNNLNVLDIPPEDIVRMVFSKYLATINNHFPIFDELSLEMVLNSVEISDGNGTPDKDILRKRLFSRIITFLISSLVCSLNSESTHNAAQLFYNSAYSEMLKYYNDQNWKFHLYYELKILFVLFLLYQFVDLSLIAPFDLIKDKSATISMLSHRICLDMGWHQTASSKTQLRLLGLCCSYDSIVSYHRRSPPQMLLATVNPTILRDLRAQQPFEIYYYFNQFYDIKTQANENQKVIDLYALYDSIVLCSKGYEKNSNDSNDSSLFSNIRYLSLLAIKASISLELNNTAVFKECRVEFSEIMESRLGAIPCILDSFLFNLNLAGNI